MGLSLRPFTSNDIGMCEKLAQNIVSEQYQSRYYPHSFNGKDFSSNEVLWSWYIIIADREEVGTIWLEKKTFTVFCLFMKVDQEYHSPEFNTIY
ncbi:MAG: hypothetical protein FD147_2584 [Chloroflexi bacterium]|nr:MAG: hypothetical protein FD147_2584 [Chloroflexota bacterium]